MSEGVEPDDVVNAAGAWAGAVASMAALSLEMGPARAVMQPDTTRSGRC